MDVASGLDLILISPQSWSVNHPLSDVDITPPPLYEVLVLFTLELVLFALEFVSFALEFVLFRFDVLVLLVLDLLEFTGDITVGPVSVYVIVPYRPLQCGVFVVTFSINNVKYLQYSMRYYLLCLHSFITYIFY